MQQQIICYLFPFKAYFYRPGFYFILFFIMPVDKIEKK